MNFNTTNNATDQIKDKNLFPDYSFYNSDNFWSIDPLILGENSKALVDDTLIRDNQDMNTLSEGLCRNSSFNSNMLPNDETSTFVKDINSLKGLTFKKPINRRILRKLPIHFIDSKDWQMYMEFATMKNTIGAMGSSSSFGKSSKLKNNKIHRLLNSFYNLYQEYADLNEEYELLRKQVCEHVSPTNSFSSDDIAHSHSKTKSLNSKKLMPMPIPDMKDVDENIKNLTCNKNDVTTQTCSNFEWSDLNDIQLVELINSNDYVPNGSNTSKKWNLNIHIPNKKGSVNGLSENCNIISTKAKKSKVYDHLTRQNFLGQQCVDIIEEVQSNRPLIMHKMNLINNGSNISTDDISQNDFINSSFIFNSIASALRCATSKSGNTSNSNNANISLVNLPILMDMMLPKIQQKIQHVFDECPFLNNPLEIMAELRNFNYNKQATAEYFKFTKQLRGSIKEFISNNIDCRSRMVILRSLYRDYHNFTSNSGEFDNKMSKLSACSNCGQSMLQNEEDGDNVEDYGEDFNKETVGFNDKINDDGRSMDCDSNVNEYNRYHMLTKGTDIEPGIFDNAIQDSFTQTLELKMTSNIDQIRKFGEGVFKNVIMLKKSIKESKIQVCHLRRQVSSLLKALKNNIDLIISLSSKHFISDQHKGRIMLLARQVEELKLKLKDEETKRRLVYNLMQEQMGNVRVYCRCRDIPHNENILEIQDNESIVLPILPQERFDFDKVFPSNMSQKDIYEEFRPLVMSFIDGFNVCFITYGSEASGKTYTLIGGNSDLTIDENGIMQRALNTLLNEQRLRSRDWDYKIAACLVEIYNDNCIDLLSGETGIQLYVDCGMESVYQKLKSVPITSETDAEVLVQLCRVKRKVARTALNPASSRSHLITLIRLQGRSKIHGENIRSFMCLCDLAGFEDIIKAETQSNKTLSKEAGYINRSLTAFNRVFVSLRRQDPNTVCYRDTKLTHLLKPFLTNSGKCALIITVRTDRRSLSSTQNTLRFGRETRGVSLGKARRQVNN